MSTPAALKVKQIAVDELHNAPWNANRVPDDVLDKVRRSIAEFGVVENLVARPRPEGGYEVISGNHRLGIYREMGVTKAPVHVVELDDARARILAQTLNRTRGQDDAEAYAALLGDVLAEMEMDDVLAYLPETERSISQALDALTAEAGDDADDVPEPPEEPESKHGEIYELGPHRLMCGDSTNPDDVARLLEDVGGKVALVVTDPPYAIYGSATGMHSDIADDKMVRPMFRDVLSMAQRATRPGAHVYVFCDWRSYASWWEVAKSTRLIAKNCIVWDKESKGMGTNWGNTHELVIFFLNQNEKSRMGSHAGAAKQRPVYKENILRHPRVRDEKEHNAQKPVDLIGDIVVAGSDKGDAVLDLFGGSGSTLIAADKTGRRAFLMELDPRYCDVIRQRWEKHNG